jgi:hypothetical protein
MNYYRPFSTCHLQSHCNEPTYFSSRSELLRVLFSAQKVRGEFLSIDHRACFSYRSSTPRLLWNNMERAYRLPTNIQELQIDDE